MQSAKAEPRLQCDHSVDALVAGRDGKFCGPVRGRPARPAAQAGDGRGRLASRAHTRAFLKMLPRQPPRSTRKRSRKPSRTRATRTTTSRKRTSRRPSMAGRSTRPC